MADPTTQYATDVLAGRLPAGRLVRLACQRHLDDLTHQAERGLLWRPDEAAAVFEFFESILCLPEETDADDDAEDGPPPTHGKPFILSPWQKFIAGSLFGWYKTRGTKTSRRFRVAYVETGKGSGKTPLGAGIMLYLLVADGERGAQVYMAAVTKDQAKLAFADAERMVAASPHLRAMVDAKLNNLAVLETGSYMRPVSAEKRGLDGKRVHGAMIDELHEHPSGLVVQKIRAGTKGRRNAMIFIPTNAGYDRESVCWEYHEHSRRVLERSEDNDAWFAYVCQLDACEACAAAGKLQPSEECAQCDDWKTEGPHWLKVNPNLGVSLPWQYLREQVREATLMPSQRNIVKRLNFCHWTDQVTVWIPVEQWSACKGTATAASLMGRSCYVGIDASVRRDPSAVSLVFVSHDGAAPEAGSLNLNISVDVLVYFWLPSNGLADRAREDGIDYPAMRDMGILRVSHGPLIDLDDIYDAITKEFGVKYRIQKIGYDPARTGQLGSRLSGHFGAENVIEIPQWFNSINEACQLFDALVFSQKLRHDGNRMLAWNIANLGKEENRDRKIRPVKMHEAKRIDGASAIIDALGIVVRQPPPVEHVFTDLLML